MTVDGNTLYFAYDASGTPMSVTYNGTNYYYATNLQGDVTAILNASGTAVVQYTYDAWGKILTTTGSMASTLGVHNPLRYRGYVYDTETTLYYLQSRYYAPELGRFINADAYISTGRGILGNNMFAYCRSNLVCRVDKLGLVEMDCFDQIDDEIDVTPGEDDLGYTSGNPLAAYMEKVTSFFQSPQRGVAGKGWDGDTGWRLNIHAIATGGTHTTLKGGVPTQSQAMQLIAEAGGNYMRVEGAHDAPNPHNYPHINYFVNDIKGTVRILLTEQEGAISNDGNRWK